MLTQDQKQTLFTLAITRTLAQGEPCTTEDRLGYQYGRQTAEGKDLRCAIGWLMTEEDLSQDFSGWITTLVREGDVKELAGVPVSEDDGPFLRRLQRVHDDAAAATRTPEGFLADLKQRALDLAMFEGLSTEGVL